MYFVGIDVSMKVSSLCILDKDGMIVEETTAPSDPQLIASVISPYGLADMKIGLETGSMTPWLFHELKALGTDVVCLEARHVHQILKAQRNKSDRSDAHGLAQMVRSGWYTGVHVKSYDSHALRALLKARAELVHTRQNLENTVRGLMKPFGLRLPAGGRPDFARRARVACAEFPMLAAAVQSMLAARDTIEAEIADLDKRLAELAHQSEASRRVMTVPGVGPITALAAISAIDEVNRFGRARTMGAYFGLTPRRHQSGDVDYHGRITKRGDAMVRALLYEAATVLLSRVKKFSSLKAWGLKLAKRIGIKRARVAVARKLAVIIAAILKDGTEFWWKLEQPKAA